MKLMLESEKTELLDMYKKKLQHIELKKAELEGEINALNEVITSLEKVETASEIAVSMFRVKGM